MIEAFSIFLDWLSGFCISVLSDTVIGFFFVILIVLLALEFIFNIFMLRRF